MKELKALYDAVIMAKKVIPKETWEGITPMLKSAGRVLHTTHSFVYKGKLKCEGRATLIKLPGINMDFDDVARMVCNKPNGPLDHEVELRITVFDPAAKPDVETTEAVTETVTEAVVESKDAA